MELTNRITRVLYLDGTGVLLADVVGRIHLLDTDLRLLRSSPVIDGGLPIHGLAADHRWVVGRDRGGTVLRWSLTELDLLDRLDPAGRAGQVRAATSGARCRPGPCRPPTGDLRPARGSASHHRSPARSGAAGDRCRAGESGRPHRPAAPRSRQGRGPW